MTHHVVIVGGGFGGLTAARALRRRDVRVTLIDRRNFHLFQPLLYQVATGGLSPANIAVPLRAILRRQKNVEVLLGEVVAVDPENRRVVLADGHVSYDSLILAAGARTFYFGNDRFEAQAPGLKSIEDATQIRRRIMSAFEAAERIASQAPVDQDELQRWLTFVIVGGGPTGVELAGAVTELARYTLRKEFRHVDTRVARVILVEHQKQVLHMYDDPLPEKARASLERIGVTVRTGYLLADITPESVEIRSDEGAETIATRNVFWGAGVQASPLGILVARATDAQTDRSGRLIVQPDCSLPGHESIYVIGDLAHFAHDGDAPLPGVAPVAIQQARFVADVISRRLRGQPAAAFKYKDRGQMATIGRAAAVVQTAGIHLTGLVAWVVWLFLHLIMLVGFENRLLVLLQWGWNYLTRNRSARLITYSDGILFEDAHPLDAEGPEGETTTSEVEKQE